MATVNYQSILAQIDLQDFLNRDEKGDSEFFAQMFKGQAVYDHAGKVWYLWLGQYWELDAVQDVIGYVMNRVASEYQFKAATERKHGNSAFEKILLDRAKKLHSLKRAKNVLEIARSEPEIRIAGTEWDSNPDLLPVNNGVIDLKTGKMRDALPTEYIRHHSPVDWIDLKEPCPLWDKTLLGIFDGNTEMIDFIQRLFGYAITGHVTEHRLPIFLGESARNGKTTIFEAQHNILGDDFSASIPMIGLLTT